MFIGISDSGAELSENQLHGQTLSEVVQAAEVDVLDITATSIGETYARRLRNSSELETILAAKGISEPVQFEPNSDVTKSVKVTATDDGVRMQVSDKIEEEDPDTGYTAHAKNSVIAHFVDDAIESLSLINNVQDAPLVGHINSYECTDDGVTSSTLLIS